MSSDPKRWLHPQAVPRGFLRLYILTMLSRGPQSGYTIMDRIDERTESAWRPGAGTIYPLLKSLAREGLARASSQKKGSAKSYVLTAKGSRELRRIRANLPGMTRRQPVMGKLFSDILPPGAIVQIMLRMAREGLGDFGEKASQLPRAERESAIKEMKLLLQRQLAALDSRELG
jgi:DNA-binding PadR family transcriptional regulator